MVYKCRPSCISYLLKSSKFLTHQVEGLGKICFHPDRFQFSPFPRLYRTQFCRVGLLYSVHGFSSPLLCAFLNVVGTGSISPHKLTITLMSKKMRDIMVFLRDYYFWAISRDFLRGQKSLGPPQKVPRNSSKIIVTNFLKQW